MVIARILAELIALSILVALPILLYCHGKLSILPSGHIVFPAAAAIALLILPLYGFITWQVIAGEEGLAALALFRQQRCRWNEIQGMVRRTSWNWSRYVVELTEGEFVFPIWLNNCDELVETIKAHLPEKATSSNPFRQFECDSLAFTMMVAQSLVGLIFVAISWFFFSTTLRKSAEMSDVYAVGSFCILASAVLGWRTMKVVLMPQSVQLTPDALILQTLFFKRAYPWTDVLKLARPNPLLPEGFMIKCKGGSYLVSGAMDRCDELEEALRDRIQARALMGMRSAADLMMETMLAEGSLIAIEPESSNNAASAITAAADEPSVSTTASQELPASIEPRNEMGATERPIEIAATERPIEAAVTERPSEIEVTERPIEAAVTERPIEIEATERPIETAAIKRPIEIEATERPIEAAAIERPSEIGATERPIEIEATERPIETAAIKPPSEMTSAGDSPNSMTPADPHSDLRTGKDGKDSTNRKDERKTKRRKKQ